MSNDLKTAFWKTPPFSFRTRGDDVKENEHEWSGGANEKSDRVGSGVFWWAAKYKGMDDICYLMELSLIHYEFPDQNVIVGQILQALS